MEAKLPELPYAYDALEPYIDAATMETHHTKHHQTYVNNLNKALEEHPQLVRGSVEDLLADHVNLPDGARQAIVNNGGGHVNHALFWRTIAPPQRGAGPQGRLADAIDDTFDSFAHFQKRFSNAAATRFGSGWAWLALDRSGELHITSTANQDTPLMEGHTPILCLDVWEHAYYLKYQNRRAEYVSAWWNVVNWDVVEQLFKAGR